MFESYFCGIEIKILNKVVVGVHYLFKQSSAMEGHLLVIFISGSYAAGPNETVHEGVGNIFFLVVSILTAFEAIFRMAHYLDKSG